MVALESDQTVDCGWQMHKWDTNYRIENVQAHDVYNSLRQRDAGVEYEKW